MQIHGSTYALRKGELTKRERFAGYCLVSQNLSRSQTALLGGLNDFSEYPGGFGQRASEVRSLA